MFKNKTALSYFSTKLTNKKEFTVIEQHTNIKLNILKSLNNPKIENTDIIKNIKLVIIAK